MHVQFEVTSDLGVSVLREDRQYDVATCMFALHYFFDKESSLKALLETVAASLKPGAAGSLRLSQPSATA